MSHQHDKSGPAAGAPPSLQDGIDRAGSPIKLLWKPNPPTQAVPVVQPEFSGWAEEQRAWTRDGTVLYDLCHHMNDLFIEGPDAMRLLSAVSANDYEVFEIGQAKQFVPVTERGDIITDGILMRMAEDKFILSGVPASQSWVRYHADRGGYDVVYRADPDSANRRTGGPPAMFRYQVQGARAIEVVERAMGGPAPKVKFFHSEEVTIGGRKLRAFRHGMAGQAGFELLGDWADNEAVKAALLEAGEAVDLVQVGGKAYYTNGIESGWIPTPTPGIYTDPALEDYRKYVSLFSYEGQKPIHGSYFSENIEDYYVSPYELGYGRSIKFNHDFIGREALEAAKDAAPRTRVTLVFNPDDVRRVLGADLGYLLRYARDRVEVNGELVGQSMYTANFAEHGTILSLGLIDKRHAQPGTEVTIAWGEHPGPGTPPEAHEAFPRIRATVQPSPYNSFAREEYRKAV